MGLTMNKRILAVASLLGALAVILGAFGAHGLKTLIGTNELDIWAKGVEYQFYHVFALLFLAGLSNAAPRLVNSAFWCFLLGILFFSGSLYLLSTREISRLSFVGYIGPVTPVGGLLLISGWICLFLAALKQR